MIIKVGRDPIALNRISVMSKVRKPRPKEFCCISTEEQNVLPVCPFCPGNEELNPSVTLVLKFDASGLRFYIEEGECHNWVVRIVPNKYPAFSTHTVGPGYGYH